MGLMMIEADDGRGDGKVDRTIGGGEHVDPRVIHAACGGKNGIDGLVRQ